MFHLLAEQAKLYLSTGMYCAKSLDGWSFWFQSLHGVIDHTRECQILFSFTKFPQNSAPLAVQVPV